MTTTIQLTELQAAEAVSGIEGLRLSIPVKLIRLLGCDLAAAAFLKQAAFLSSLSLKSGKAGWFDLPQIGEPRADIDSDESIFAKLGSWQSTIGIGPDGQREVRKQLRDLGLLEEERKGIPARTHYRVLPSKFLLYMASEPSCGNSRNKKPESPEQGEEIPAAGPGQTPHQDAANPATNPESFEESFEITTTTPGDNGGGEQMTMTPPAGVPEKEIEELIASARWANKSFINDEIGWEKSIRDRLQREGATPRDSAILEKYRAAMRGESTNSLPWFLSEQGILEKGAELGIKPPRLENKFHIFRDRVYSAAGVNEEMIRKARIDMGSYFGR